MEGTRKKLHATSLEDQLPCLGAYLGRYILHGSNLCRNVMCYRGGCGVDSLTLTLQAPRTWRVSCTEESRARHIT